MTTSTVDFANCIIWPPGTTIWLGSSTVAGPLIRAHPKHSANGQKPHLVTVNIDWQ